MNAQNFSNPYNCPDSQSFIVSAWKSLYRSGRNFFSRP